MRIAIAAVAAFAIGVVEAASAPAVAQQVESSKMSAGGVVQNGSPQSSKMSAGGVVQNGSPQSSKMSAGGVVQNGSPQSSKISVGIILQTRAVPPANIPHAPLTHW